MFEGTPKAPKGAKAKQANPNADHDFLNELEQEVTPAENLQEVNHGAKALEIATTGTVSVPAVIESAPASPSLIQPVSELWGEVDEMAENPAALVDLGGEVLKFEGWTLNEKRIYMAMAMTTFIDQVSGREVPAIQLQDREGNGYICPATLMVSAYNKLPRVPAPIIVTYLGVPPGKKYHNIRVQTLTQKA
jgi:hypothetical protein